MIPAGLRIAPEALLSELATPLSQVEKSIGGPARKRPAYGPDMETVAALWELLAYVLGSYAPRPGVVSQWTSAKQAAARRWGERELARKVLGGDGRPSFSPPAVLARYVDRWEAGS